MPRKKKQAITKDMAIQVSIHMAAEELNNKGFKPLARAYSIKKDGTIHTCDMYMNGEPSKSEIQEIVKSGFKQKGLYVILVLTNPISDETKEFIIAAYDNSYNVEVRKSPYIIKNNKIEPLARSAKGFDVFLEDE